MDTAHEFILIRIRTENSNLFSEPQMNTDNHGTAKDAEDAEVTRIRNAK